MTRRTASNIEQLIVEAVLSGNSGTRAGELFGISASGITNILRRRGIKPKIGRPPVRAIDHHAFDVISPESAYWIGFLFADGTIGSYDNGAPTLGLGLSSKDRTHVEKFRAFLKSDHKIATYAVKPDKLIKTKRACASISIRSERLVAQLRAWGMIGKCPDRVPNPKIEDSTDFWRGMVDGDGTVREHLDKRRGYLYPSLILCGHMPVIESFQAFLLRRGISANITNTSTCIFQIRLMGSGALKVIRALYENAVVALDRKLTTARMLMDRAVFKDA